MKREMCVYAYTYLYIYTHTHTYVYIYVYAYIRMNACRLAVWMAGWMPSIVCYEHGNDTPFYNAVETDSLIAVLWHFSAFLSFGCL